jgi:thiosulfate/3-mercaptopyruvate sulfurtransferase
MPDALPTPIVSTEWLAAHLGEPGLVVLDASWYLAAMQRDAQAEYTAGHIPGALFWDIDRLSDGQSSLPHMLPDPASLARDIGALGIADGDRVVVYDGSGINLSAPRVWWTFRIAGHDEVAVLDGGLTRWKAEGRALEAGTVSRPTARFTVRLRPALRKSQEEMTAALVTGAWQVLDARSSGRFAGTEPEPRPGLRGGHLPGSRSLPFTELVGPLGTLLPAAELRARYERAGIDLARPIVATCGSGVTACALVLGLHRLGIHDTAVYDGSWSEWGREAGPPIEQGPPA